MARTNPKPRKLVPQLTSTERDAQSKALAIRVAQLAWEKKAFDLRVMHVGPIAQYTDYIIVCSAQNDRQSVAICDFVEATLLEEQGLKPTGVEGKRFGHWVLVDFGDVVLHVLSRPAREYYELERLWGDAPRLELPEPAWVKAETHEEAYDHLDFDPRRTADRPSALTH